MHPSSSPRVGIRGRAGQRDAKLSPAVAEACDSHSHRHQSERKKRFDLKRPALQPRLRGGAGDSKPCAGAYAPAGIGCAGQSSSHLTACILAHITAHRHARGSAGARTCPRRNGVQLGLPIAAWLAWMASLSAGPDEMLVAGRRLGWKAAGKCSWRVYHLPGPPGVDRHAPERRLCDIKTPFIGSHPASGRGVLFVARLPPIVAATRPIVATSELDDGHAAGVVR